MSDSKGKELLFGKDAGNRGFTACEMAGHPVGQVKNGKCGMCGESSILASDQVIVKQGIAPISCPQCFSKNTRPCDVNYIGGEVPGL